jgi:hypothetical protein
MSASITKDSIVNEEADMPDESVFIFNTPGISWFYLVVILFISIGS